MEAPAKFVPSDVLYWSRGRLGGWQLGCVCAVGIRVVRKNILHSAKGKRRRTFSPTCPSIRRHGGRGEVGVAELTASAGAEESCGKQVEIRGVPAGVRPRFTLEDQGRSTTSSSKRRHHMVSGSATAPQPLYAALIFFSRGTLYNKMGVIKSGLFRFLHPFGNSYFAAGVPIL